MESLAPIHIREGFDEELSPIGTIYFTGQKKQMTGYDIHKFEQKTGEAELLRFILPPERIEATRGQGATLVRVRADGNLLCEQWNFVETSI